MKIVVGDNFDEIVLDESKDVLLEVLLYHSPLIKRYGFNVFSSHQYFVLETKLRSMHHGVAIVKPLSQCITSLPNIYKKLILLS